MTSEKATGNRQQAAGEITAENAEDAESDQSPGREHGAGSERRTFGGLSLEFVSTTVVRDLRECGRNGAADAVIDLVTTAEQNARLRARVEAQAASNEKMAATIKQLAAEVDGLKALLTHADAMLGAATEIQICAKAGLGDEILLEKINKLTDAAFRYQEAKKATPAPGACDPRGTGSDKASPSASSAPSAVNTPGGDA